MTPIHGNTVMGQPQSLSDQGVAGIVSMLPIGIEYLSMEYGLVEEFKNQPIPIGYSDIDTRV